MIASRDTISYTDWISESTIVELSRKRRARLVKRLAEYNGYPSIEALLEAVLSDKTTPYAVSRTLIDGLRGKGLAPLTVAESRSTLPVFWESVIGSENFNRRTYDRLVPSGDMYALRSKRIPTVEELRKMLLIANPRNRALLGFLSATGCRISEALSRKMSDIEPREGYARVNFQAKATKARTKRYAFITGEVLQWVNISRKATPWRGGITSDYVFPGRINVGPWFKGFKPSGKDKPLSRNATSYTLTNLFNYAELHQEEDEVFSPHSLRTFADNQMAKCGLDRKFIAAIIGHRSKLAAEAHYIDWQEVESQWADKCLEHFTWKIHEPTVQIIRTPGLEQAEMQRLAGTVQGLKLLVLQMTKRLYGPEAAAVMTEIEESQT